MPEHIPNNPGGEQKLNQTDTYISQFRKLQQRKQQSPNWSSDN
jgi:hypothetical protein